MRLVLPLIAAATFGAVQSAEAAITDGQTVLIATVVGVGSIGAIVTTVAAVFYMAEGRAFHTPWIVASLFSSAVCASAAIGLAQEAGDAAPVAVLAWASIGAAPLFWTVRSALNPAGFGELLDAPAPKLPPLENVSINLPQPQLALAFRF